MSEITENNSYLIECKIAANYPIDIAEVRLWPKHSFFDELDTILANFWSLIWDLLGGQDSDYRSGETQGYSLKFNWMCCDREFILQEVNGTFGLDCFKIVYDFQGDKAIILHTPDYFICYRSGKEEMASYRISRASLPDKDDEKKWIAITKVDFRESFCHQPLNREAIAMTKNFFEQLITRIVKQSYLEGKEVPDSLANYNIETSLRAER